MLETAWFTAKDGELAGAGSAPRAGAGAERRSRTTGATSEGTGLALQRQMTCSHPGKESRYGRVGDRSPGREALGLRNGGTGGTGKCNLE